MDADVDAEEWDDEDYAEDGDTDGDDDLEAEAEQLGAQLWADIQNAVTASEPPPPTATAAEGEPAPVDPPPISATMARKQASVVMTVKTILGYAAKHPVLESALRGVLVGGDNVYSILSTISQSGSITRGVAFPLSQTLIGIAQSDVLSAASRGMFKRKREETEEPKESPPAKRPMAFDALTMRLSAAVSTISVALTASPIDVASIRPSLHDVFIFSVTARPTNILREISGLIQVVGLLERVQIGQPSSDLGTAVYPCTQQNCSKTFSRLSSLRVHHNFHLNAAERPFQCTQCTASFQRKNELKRHTKLHEQTAWKCSSCSKVFSRKDALKRHRNAGKSRGDTQGLACADGTDIELVGSEVEAIREERRVKLSLAVTTVKDDGPVVEDGEIDVRVITQLQSSIEGLQQPLQTHVIAALAKTSSTATSTSISPSTALPADSPATALSVYGLSEEQTRAVELAISKAASEAQARAEAEDALEEDEDDDDDMEVDADRDVGPMPAAP